MLISIVIPTLNEEGQIVTTLQALEQLKGNKQIIVVDGGSSDRTAELVVARGVTLVTSKRGRGQQMHSGALASEGDVLWFVHADTVPPADALEAIAEALQDRSVVGGNFGLSFDGSSRAAQRMTRIYPFLRYLRLCYGDSGIFVRRNVYTAIGGFAPLALFEDLDLLRRLRNAGQFVHLPDRITTSSRRFEQRNFGLIWAYWTTLQILYWCGVPPNLLARSYTQVRVYKK